MKRCLQIAKNGLGTTRPNPSVGAVIVHQNKIIGEGFTATFGGNHAEVNAINSVENKALLKEATIYVTLEPCSHFGKTPPCADLIVKHQLKKVVIGCLDANSLVAGKGIERLKNANIEVVVGVLEDECRTHHKRFFTVQEKKRPYIILKWAETKDGFVAPKSKNENKPVFISNKYSQQLVHKLRSKEHAILVGTNTVLADNPKLNVRSWFGENPIRIVLDRTLRIPESVHILDGSVQTILITEKRDDKKDARIKSLALRENLIFEEIDFSKKIASQICSVLYKHNMQSLIVEGGTQTLQTFIDENLWDEAMVFIGDNNFKDGIKSPEIKKKYTQENIKKDVLKTYYND
ncbi:bifunctional diaminohydroxyphosphoribosylaminopyrimidine deaminase/5-amino-6-(5-phosphoribosylamino)uracil reductase RibD [Polaribacter sp. IC073]|uniref:bifunctional diaminohydroxyphosphoribosylaminopyrimidine deaminase/5-amino-6-(5-phosphoribosylamino)uracil reductase RibD n=1 Tax=Polaribacter sp. IC073 TaxID=2508540 RepID=UPI0011BF3F62|nr:bifunctional diaminohydroxyphosphoribosylaminopyrimidine deaminase/5-amino-6-(5-phosphoribosylamino)uracil reductase RibD [Polaribacter sp. IC073]TXD46501.1 bifunctional diaminohydroxyphosphoribosylaminopyrimidine deaminase/5-amino-6-(5-phosphoribosylamino)uracil reductase RibD [Polaribacter sp. IC073]